MYKFKFADIGEGIHEGQILKWMFKVGDQVKDGDTLCLVETDKVNAEIPSPVNGKIAEILVKEGETVHVGDVFVKIDDGRMDVEENSPVIEPVKEGEKNSSGVVGQIEVSSEVIESSEEHEQKRNKGHMKKLATPVARKLARDLGVDIETINGSGPMGRVMKEDIYNYQGKGQEINITPRIPEIESTSVVERIPLSKLRKTIAKNMMLSHTIIPQAATMDDFDITKLVLFRKEQKEIALQQGINLTYMPFIIKAVTTVLKEFPIFNSSYDEAKEEIILKKSLNIGIAVDTPDGLIVPVIKNADLKSIFTIAKELESLSTKTRERTISLDSLQGGTFTITNYGALGSTYGVPIIKHPEVGILGVGKITKKPAVINDEIVIRDFLPISLCIDHRIIDGGDAGRFLLKLKEYLSDPMILLLS